MTITAYFSGGPLDKQELQVPSNQGNDYFYQYDSGDNRYTYERIVDLDLNSETLNPLLANATGTSEIRTIFMLIEITPLSLLPITPTGIELGTVVQFGKNNPLINPNLDATIILNKSLITFKFDGGSTLGQQPLIHIVGLLRSTTTGPLLIVPIKTSFTSSDSSGISRRYHPWVMQAGYTITSQWFVPAYVNTALSPWSNAVEAILSGV